MNILLSGGSRGLGLEIARTLVSSGDRIIVVSRSMSPELRELQQNYPGCVDFIECDLGQNGEIRERVFEPLRKSGTVIDGLVNNAAGAYDDLVSNLDLELLETMFRVNVYAPMLLTKGAIRNMLLHRTAGSIVHVSSICTRKGYKGLSMYAASKGALEAFSLNTAREWGKLGIRSNCVLPGFMETEMSSKLTSEQKEKIYSRNSLGVPTDLVAVTSLVAYLLRDQSKSVTGQSFVVDAGAI